MNRPLFRAIQADDREMNAAHARASATISEFLRLVREGGDVRYMAKLSFKDPDRSDRTGEDCLLYLWLSEVVYHPAEGIFSGVFFEVPQEHEKWHQVGQRLGFHAEDVFDWMTVEDGHLRGGFTIRATRSRLESAEEQAQYDEYIGVSSYEPLDEGP